MQQAAVYPAGAPAPTLVGPVDRGIQGDALGAFRDHLVGNKASPHTVQMYCCHVRSLLNWAHKPVEEITAGDLEHYKRDRVASGRGPRLLAPMQRMLGERRVRLTATTMRTLLDGIGVRLDEGREISRYMIALLVFLGLLGTFWGLLETVDAIVRVIQGLFVGTGNSGEELSKVFERFKDGLLGTLHSRYRLIETSLARLSPGVSREF